MAHALTSSITISSTTIGDDKNIPASTAEIENTERESAIIAESTVTETTATESSVFKSSVIEDTGNTETASNTNRKTRVIGNPPANSSLRGKTSATSALTLLLTLLATPMTAAELLPSGADPLNANTGFGQGQTLIQPHDNEVLPADTAFALSAIVEADSSIVLMWEIRPGYYLYRKSLAVETVDGSALTDLQLPEAETVTDEFFGEVAIYRDKLLLRIPLSQVQAAPDATLIEDTTIESTAIEGATIEGATAAKGTTIELLLTYQGCAEQLYCYPPQQKAISLALPD